MGQERGPCLGAFLCLWALCFRMTATTSVQAEVRHLDSHPWSCFWQRGRIQTARQSSGWILLPWRSWQAAENPGWNASALCTSLAMSELLGSLGHERLEALAAPPPLDQGIMAAAAARAAVFRELRVVTLERRAPSIQAGGGRSVYVGPLFRWGLPWRSQRLRCRLSSAHALRRGFAARIVGLAGRVAPRHSTPAREVGRRLHETLVRCGTGVAEGGA